MTHYAAVDTAMVVDPSGDVYLYAGARRLHGGGRRVGRRELIRPASSCGRVTAWSAARGRRKRPLARVSAGDRLVPRVAVASL